MFKVIFAFQRNEQLRMDVNSFFVAGINYKKAEAEIRGQFAVNHDQYANLLSLAPSYGLNELFVLSTCNRTEIYGFAHSPIQLIELLCTQTRGNVTDFLKSACIKNGQEAIEHIFSVGAGLDSQILGDYEIIGQLKTAVKFSKQHGFVGAFTERLINSVLQSSKRIKNNTQLSGGMVSVAFAAVQYIRNTVTEIQHKNILLLGVGKIGRNTCKNLVDYVATRSITLINRTPGKASSLATELGLKHADISQLDEELKKADVILAATNADKPVILQKHLKNAGDKLIIDLSIPSNVEEAAQHLSNVRIVNVDELSKLKDETLKKRQAEVPKAKAIIAELMNEFAEWCSMRKHTSVLKDLKLKLKEIYTHPLYTNPTYCTKTLDIKIQQVLNETAGKIKTENQRGCHYITAINNFIGSR